MVDENHDAFRRHSRESGDPGAGGEAALLPRPRPWIPAFQAVSKRDPREAQTPEVVIPAKAGIQAGWSGETLL